MALGRLGRPGRRALRDAGVPSTARASCGPCCRFVPWGRDGLSLDLMRRDRDAENGLMEFMVIELLQRAEEIGRRAGLAELRDVPLGLRAGRAARRGAGAAAVALAADFFSRWWQIESLYRANAKYRPIWEPRFLLFEKSADLPRIGMAAARAEGFLEAPGLPQGCGAAARGRLETQR